MENTTGNTESNPVSPSESHGNVTTNNHTNNKNRNKNRSRNRSKKDKKGNNDEQASEFPLGENSSESSTNNQSKNVKSKDQSKKRNNEKKQNKPKRQTVTALYKEIEKVFPIINPITVNGIPIKSLSTDPLTYIQKIINDKKNQNDIFMTFLMKPTDPDFPYDIDLLTVTLSIPQSYPNKLPSPTIMILNDDIPRGYSVNIEIGFKQIVATVLENRLNRKLKNKKEQKNTGDNESTNEETCSQDTTKKIADDSLINEADAEGELKINVFGGNDLLGMIKTLDKYLEKFLAMEKKDTIKLVKVINKKQELASEKEKEQQAKQTKNINDTPPNIDLEKFEKRKRDIEIFRQKLKDNSITVFKDNAQGTTFKMCLIFRDENLTVEFDDSEEITIERIYIKLMVPKEYINSPKKGIKMLIDMSNSHNIDLINSVKDTSVRLIFGRLLNNMNKNFEIFANDVAVINWEYVAQNTEDSQPANQYWSLASQLNFFVYNVQKFMNERPDFQNWYNANKAMNNQLKQ